MLKCPFLSLYPLQTIPCPIIRNLLPLLRSLLKQRSHVETTSLALQQKPADGIKDVSKSNSAIQQHDLKTLTQSFDKLTTLSQSLGKLNTEILKLNTGNASQVKNQKLEWAIHIVESIPSNFT